MLSFLKNIIEVIEYVPQYILWALETIFNLFTSAVGALFAVAAALIALPSEPSPPEFIGAINWYFPIGALISIATPIVVAYGSFLAIAWILRKVGDL